MKKSNLMPSVVLGCICLVVALLLSVVNMFTAPVIEAANEAAANAALTEVLPGGSGFKEIEITSDYPAVVTKGYKADGGYVFQMSVVGYKPGLVIMCGVDSEGKIAGVKHVQSSETYGMENELNGAYIGDTLDSVELVLATGATSGSKSSKAYFDAIKAALQSYIIANGGSVDVRTPEQILQDNCNAALGTEGKTFVRWFATEVLVGVDKVYTTDVGCVFVIGESFIGVTPSGVTTPDVSTEDTSTVTAAYNTIAASVANPPTEIDVPELGASAKQFVKKAYVTESGNYVFDLVANGYDVGFDYSEGNMAGTPKQISIKLSIAADGKIIDCMTVDHSESSGVGDICATDEYRDSWHGAENSDLSVTVGTPDYDSDLIPEGSTDLGAIAGATFTAQGYQSAVKAAFAAFELLTNEGGNE